MAIEAMKLALEALEYILPDTPDQRMKRDSAITTLRAAIEAAKKQEPVAWVNLDQYGNLHESSSQNVPPDTFPVYRSPPVTQQEPVAYLLGTKSRPDLPYHSKGLVFPDQMVGFGISVVQAHQARVSDGQIHEAVPLYTTPPAAQPAPVQVSPTDFVDMVMDKEDAIGKPIFWAEWPNREKNT